jgi:putative peptide zinc metalloprotease protein
VRYLLEHKLHPLGLVTGNDGSAPKLERLNPILGLRFRVGVIPPPVVNAVAGVLRPLFVPPVIVAVLGGLLAFDVWLVAFHGIGAGLTRVIDQPTLSLLIFALAFASLAFHELGHATACRHSGGRPGAIGVGLYIVWPAFYTDVTDSYRFNRAGRLRTDLGGMYFNAIFALGLVAMYFATGFEPLLLAIVAQHLMVVDQFVPWMRLDGYYVVSDLIGVADLFLRIKPVLRSLRPGRPTDPRVAELKRWARTAVTLWVVTTVTILACGIAFVITHAPPFLERAWASLLIQVDTVERAVAEGHVAEAVNGGLSAILLVLPVVAVLLTYLMICRIGGSALGARRARAALATARPSESAPQT